MTFSTTYDLLKEAQSGAPVGTGSNHVIVELPGGEFGKYLLKHQPHALRRTTALTPVDYGLRMNFGHPVLVDVAHAANDMNPFDVAILHKVQGESLRDISYNLHRNYAQQSKDIAGAGLKADEKILDLLAGLPDFSFEQWMQGKRHQIDVGVGGDNVRGNVMYDKAGQTLRDIDVVDFGNEKWHLNNVDDIIKKLTLENFKDKSASHLHPRQTAAYETIRSKMLKAADKAGVPRDGLCFGSRTAPEFKPAFLTHLGKISLSDAPEKLLAMLSEMEVRCPLR